MRVLLENLSKHFGSVIAVDKVNLDIKDGEFVAFLGPSGCGKTTTLLMIAGIYKPTEGYIKFDEQVVNYKPPKARNIGMVFQSYALYPHMTVFENITFPMKLKKTPVTMMKERAQKVAAMMGIAHLLDRKPGQLSGGQQQRVALGRALAKEPDLLLFDEPLSNLDARLRLTMRAEIKRLQFELGITSIYVTHDQVEAMTLADRIAVIKDGKLQTFCSPDELYDHPQTMFIAGFVGNPPMNFVDVEVNRVNGDFRAYRDDLEVVIPAAQGEKTVSRGKVTLGIRPEDITIADEGIPGEAYVVEPLGRDDLVDVLVGDIHLHALADPALGLRIGNKVRLRFNTAKLQFFDPQTEESLLW